MGHKTLVFVVLGVLVSEIFSQYSVDGESEYAPDANDAEWLKSLAKLADGAEPEMNMTAVVGSDVTLPCTMDGPDEATVVWMDKYSNVLFYNDQLIIDDARFELKPSSGTWNLRISTVSPRDAGRYRCIQNTQPVTYKLLDLIVYAPSVIDRARSSKSMTATEHSNVSLVCNATGIPEPRITWTVHRKSGKSKDAQEIPSSGEVIIIYNIARFCDDTYICRAYNGIGAPDEHAMRVQVRFKPTVTVPTRTISQKLGQTTALTCIIDAFPLRFPSWTKNNVKIEPKEGKYRYENSDVTKWSMVMRLFIHNVELKDYGKYKCSFYNSVGTDQGFMNLTAPLNEMQTVAAPTSYYYTNGAVQTVTNPQNSERSSVSPPERHTTTRRGKKPYSKPTKIQVPPSLQVNGSGGGQMHVGKAVMSLSVVMATILTFL